MRRRVLGQHFLIDRSTLERMVNYGKISKNDVVLEVGAGRGELTELLAQKAGKVVAVELDKELASEALERLKSYENVEFLVGDILKLKPKGFNKVVSNPPYGISSELIDWLISSRPERIVLTLQREFASKLVAKPGAPKYLYTSVIAQLCYDISIAEVVSRRMFRPVPKVDSAIVVMVRRSGRWPSREAMELMKFLMTRRRQGLRKVLKSCSGRLGVSFEQVVESLPNEFLLKRIYWLSPEEILLCSNTLIKLRNSIK